MPSNTNQPTSMSSFSPQNSILLQGNAPADISFICLHDELDLSDQFIAKMFRVLMEVEDEEIKSLLQPTKTNETFLDIKGVHMPKFIKIGLSISDYANKAKKEG